MSETKVLHVTLPAELARLVEAKVASGEYANESEVVASSLEALAFEDDTPVVDDPVIERWLREDVVPTLDAIRDGRSKLLSAKEARQRLDAHIERRRRDAETRR